MPRERNVSDNLVIYHASKIAAAEQRQADAKAAVAKAKKNAQNDGITLKELERVMKSLKDDISDQIAALNDFGSYARAMKHPLYEKFELFEIVDRTGADVLNEAYSAGYRGGVFGAGEVMNPHDATQPAGQAWLRGHRDGQAKLMGAIGEIGAASEPDEAEEAASEAPKPSGRRGRPPGSKNRAKETNPDLH